MFGALVETIKDSRIKGKIEDTYIVVCVGMSIANFLSKQCCVEYYPLSGIIHNIIHKQYEDNGKYWDPMGSILPIV